MPSEVLPFITSYAAETIGGDDQRNHHLQTIGTPIAAVAAMGFRILFHRSFSTCWSNHGFRATNWSGLCPHIVRSSFQITASIMLKFGKEPTAKWTL